MLYSRFNESEGIYDVFEDETARAVNTDLPPPSLGAPVNGIGVPASKSGRSLPSGAVHVGQSWHARGLVVTPSSREPLGEVKPGEQVLLLAGIAGAVGVTVYLYLRGPRA